MSSSATVLDPQRFTALADELMQRPAPARVVDQLKPVEKELRRLRGEGRGYNEIWKICKEAGLECSYAHFVKAARAFLESRVTPLPTAKGRSRPRIPVSPISALPRREGNAVPSAVATAGKGGSKDPRSRVLGTSALELAERRVGS